MKLVEQMGQTGDILFRWRSWLPLLLLPLFVASFSGGHPTGSPSFEFWWEVACFAVSMVGLVLRVITVGTAPRGTSGRNTREQKAALIQGVTDLLVNVLDKPPATTFVVIDEVELENWGIGGLPVEQYRVRTQQDPQ